MNHEHVSVIAVEFSTIAIGAAVLALVLAAAALWTTFQGRRATQQWQSRADQDWRRQVQTACLDTYVLIDLTSRHEPSDVAPTGTITALRARVEEIDMRLQTLRSGAADDRVEEAIEDMHHVAVSVAAALEAERATRMSATNGESDWSRVVERTAELDLATRQVSLLVDLPL